MSYLEKSGANRRTLQDWSQNPIKNWQIRQHYVQKLVKKTDMNAVDEADAHSETSSNHSQRSQELSADSERIQPENEMVLRPLEQPVARQERPDIKITTENEVVQPQLERQQPDHYQLDDIEDAISKAAMFLEGPDDDDEEEKEEQKEDPVEMETIDVTVILTRPIDVRGHIDLQALNMMHKPATKLQVTQDNDECDVGYKKVLSRDSQT